VTGAAPGPGPWDPGLQPERTQLAWRRTVAAVAIGALVSLRVLPPALGSWAVAASGAGLLAGGALWVAAARRARSVDRLLRSPGARLPDGALLLGLVVVVTCGAALAVVAVAVGLRV
jgi:hypothetical protein